MDWLRQGTEFQKFTHGRVAAVRSHPCRLWVKNDVGMLCYANLSTRNKKEKAIRLEEISDVLLGPTSDTFRRHGVSPEDGATCFSLVLEGRTLDLRAHSEDEVPPGAPSSAGGWPASDPDGPLVAPECPSMVLECPQCREMALDGCHVRSDALACR